MKFIKKLKDLFRKKQEERPIVLDTCALETKQVMEIIEKAPKVILLTSILEEMDNHKRDKKDLGYNVRKILRESRQDKNSEKYVCVASYEKYKYNDKNIIDYCRKHRKTIIVTSDNYVCNMAKAYRLEYIFIEREEEKKKENREIHFYKNWIRVNRNKEYHIKELVVRENKVIPIQDYQQGDYLYVLKYNREKKYIEIFVYEIEFENDKYTPKEIDKQRIYYINEIYKLNFSEETENEIWKFYISNTGY